MTTGPWWGWARPLGGAVILGALVAQLGTGAFVDAFRATDAGTLLAGGTVAAVTTTCAAWRWRVVARGLGAELSMPSAVAACYRAQFLNVTLPGGVLGDVHRGARHGREGGDVGRGLRGVGWERASGQVVLAAVTAAALLQGRPFTSQAALVPVGVLVVAVLALVGLARAGRAAVSGRVHRTGRTAGPVAGAAMRMARVAAADGRALLTPAAVVGIVVASLAVVAGHVATFVLAARTVGVRMPLGDLVPLALLVLLAAGIPLNLAGWGPREGAAVWAFAAAGAGAAQGLAVAVAYGVIVVVATLPGAALLLVRSPAGDVPAGDVREVSGHG